ncbi:hypothetical protein [Erwinia aphidicola]|uniref:hypothetical protein n=1 Tax=Erwinia aphidicola TaxID=68334 RepID=UPI00301898BA
MITYLSNGFLEFPHNGIIAQRFDFHVDEKKFLVLFAEVITSDPDYHSFRSDEMGFSIPERSYDVKFDTVENFENGTFYKPASPEDVRWTPEFPRDLAEALEIAITLHHNTYLARAYFAVAETPKLQRFYNRVLQDAPADVLYEYSAGLGEGGMGYAFKTRYFHD